MISKLPKWVEFGAFALAAVAGCINAIGLLGFEHQSVSHLSGTATLVGVGVVALPIKNLLHLLGILFTFLLGASFSGYLLHGNNIKLGRSYDVALFVEATLILLAMILLSNGYSSGHYAASAACGLQNALATTYSGAVIRTTHVTGLFTDLGIMFGAKMRGEVLDKRKVGLFVIIILGFILGGVLGAFIYSVLEFYALAIPALICIFLAVIYRVYASKVHTT